MPKVAITQNPQIEAAISEGLALKNIAMSYPAADYYGHPRGSCRQPNQFFDDMHSFIAAMAKRFPIHLAIAVGHPALERMEFPAMAFAKAFRAFTEAAYGKSIQFEHA
jgi:hypothetical protein